MIAHPDQWTFVRRNANGFYVNFIQMLNPDAKKCAQTAALFTHKNAYYESDSRYTGLGGFPDGGQFSRALEAQELSALLDGGFKVPYTSLNYGVDDAKLNDLKQQGLPKGVTRPCFTQCGPWTYGGDINSAVGSAPEIRTNIAKTDGVSTDGPLSLWQADQGQMQSGSYSVVKYAHALHKTAAVMVAPYDLKPRWQWLGVAQQCVRQHEDAGARPDIWIVFEYATDTSTLPETDANGQPADTMTGMAYWLIHHVRDPKHWARITVPAAKPAAHEIDFTVRNDSPWLDLCPVVFAKVNDPHKDWRIRFRVNGQDVTRQMTQEGGLPFVGSLRLWPGSKQQVQVTLACDNPASWDAPPSIKIGLRPNPSATSQVNQRVTLRPAPMRRADLLASRQ